MPGTEGGKTTFGSWSARVDCTLSAVNSGDSRTLLRAGTCPDFAQSIERSEM